MVLKRFEIENTGEYLGTGIFILCCGHPYLVFTLHNPDNLFFDKIDMGIGIDFLKVVLVKIGSANQFIGIGFYIELLGEDLSAKEDIIPGFRDDGVKLSRSSFPKAPSSVIGFFWVFIKKQDSFVLKIGILAQCIGKH